MKAPPWWAVGLGALAAAVTAFAADLLRQTVLHNRQSNLPFAAAAVVFVVLALLFQRYHRRGGPGGA